MKTGTNIIQVHENWHKSTCPTALFKYWCFLVKVIKRRTGEDTEKTVHCTQCTKSYTKQFQLNHHVKKVFIKMVLKRYLSIRYLLKRYLSKRYLSKRYLSKRYLLKRYLLKRYLSKRYLSKRYLSFCVEGKHVILNSVKTGFLFHGFSEIFSAHFQRIKCLFFKRNHNSLRK